MPPSTGTAFFSAQVSWDVFSQATDTGCQGQLPVASTGSEGELVQPEGDWLGWSRTRKQDTGTRLGRRGVHVGHIWGVYLSYLLYLHKGLCRVFRLF